MCNEQGHVTPTRRDEKLSLLPAHVTLLPAQRLFLTSDIFIESGSQLGLKLNHKVCDPLVNTFSLCKKLDLDGNTVQYAYICTCGFGQGIESRDLSFLFCKIGMMELLTALLICCKG